MKDDFNIHLDNYIDQINKALELFLPVNNEILTEAMRYSLFAGGKRIRPLIVLEFCRLCSGDYQKAIPFACAIEMIHTYSLIYDDLPCMDNDVLRRGKKTNHVVYGEDIALMAGAGLYAEAFDILVNNYKRFNLNDIQIIEGIGVLTKASGRKGIVTGQV
jgi:geranylgeranyl diphosphate synthase type II